MRRFLKFLVTEAMGYRRPSPVTSGDREARRTMELRMGQIESRVEHIETYVDVFDSMFQRRRDRKPGGTPQ